MTESISRLIAPSFRDTDLANSVWDVIIVGGGLVGLSLACSLVTECPSLSCLIVEAGPEATCNGAHIRSIGDDAERQSATRLSQGPLRGVSISRAASAAAHNLPVSERANSLTRRAGLHEVARGNGAIRLQGATALGGMGLYWLGACPDPSPSELPTFIPYTEMRSALAEARCILSVQNDQFLDSRFTDYVQNKLADTAPFAGVKRMPMAAVRSSDTRAVTNSVEVPLRKIERQVPRRFMIRTETSCLEVKPPDTNVIRLVKLKDNQTGRTYYENTRFVVLACDAIRSAQLLYASGVRLDALGAYFNEHTQISLIAPIEMPVGTPRADLIGGPLGADLSPHESIPAGVTWLPYGVCDLPYNGMITRIDKKESLLSMSDTAALASIHLYLPELLSAENRISFSEKRTDWLGLPAPMLSENSEASEPDLREEVMRSSLNIARILGASWLPESPKVLPRGSSLHYQGTVRMGERNNGKSVCDSVGEVWGEPNLFVAGNGVIPTATASNPTLYSVALAMRSADAILRRLGLH